MGGMVPDTVLGKSGLLDLSGIVAGSKYRGEFEERIKKVLAEVAKAGTPCCSSMRFIPSSERAERKARLMHPTF